MTTTSPNGQATQEARVNNTAKASGGSGPTNRSHQAQRSALDVFANLLGLAHGESQSDALTLASRSATADLSKDDQTDDTTGTQSAQDPSILLAALLAWDPHSPRSGGHDATPSSLPSAQGKGQASAAASELLGKKPGATDGNETGISLQGMGMAPLKQTTSPDAATLAAMDVRAANASGMKHGMAESVTAQALSPDQSGAGAEGVSAPHPSNPAVALHTKMASRPANWRSTASLGPADAPGSAVRSNSLPASSNSVQTAQNAAAFLATGTSASLSSTRSTVAMDERFAASTSSDLASTSDGITSGHGLAHGPSQRDFKGDDQSGASPWTAPSPEAADEGYEEAPFLLQADLPPEDPIDANELLNPHQLRQANVSVGAGTEERIDIRIALQGEEVNVQFLSDNAEVRAGLHDEAGEMLSEMMDRSGLHLSGVSIQSQSQSSAGQQGRSQADRMVESVPARKPGAPQSTEPAAAVANRPTLRADGGPSLDIFA